MDLLRHVADLTAAEAQAQPQDVPPFDDWLHDVSQDDGPSRGLTWDARHQLLVREHLARISAGEIRRLMIFMPPQHGKSQLVTVHYSAWTLERSPRARVIIGSYSASLAENFSHTTRSICSARMPLAEDRKAVHDWQTAAGGGLRAVGVGGGITGRGGDLIIIDDPVEGREEVTSKAYRDRAWNWYRDDISTRQAPGAVIILIMTRWSEDDLAGRILQSPEADAWTVVSLPALAEANDPLGRAEGAALWPVAADGTTRYDETYLARQKALLGSSFQALYQQRPSALEGAIFKREWWRYFREAPRFHSILQSWDTAFKKGADNDYSVCTTWGQADAGYYLLDVWKRRVEFPELKAMVQTLGEQFKPNVVLVEDKASGQSLIQELQRDTRLPILPIKADTDKISRAYAVTPMIETGRVLLAEGAPWLTDYLDSMANFPNAAHDDDVDSTTQALNYLVGRNNETGLLEFMRQQVEAMGANDPTSEARTVRLRAPANVGAVQWFGQMLPIGADRVVEAPASLVNDLLRAGYERVEVAAL
ncbi:MAG TPA: phage terminase large subunit [Casimicrobiaceae bacterium]|nr:phage terminase large subunit [Casimicrobiaceae bacterium]